MSLGRTNSSISYIHPSSINSDERIYLSDNYEVYHLIRRKQACPRVFMQPVEFEGEKLLMIETDLAGWELSQSGKNI